jgi:hypothetical protein
MHWIVVGILISIGTVTAPVIICMSVAVIHDFFPHRPILGFVWRSSVGRDAPSAELQYPEIAGAIACVLGAILCGTITIWLLRLFIWQRQ